MNWVLAIERNRMALGGIVAGLCALAGLSGASGLAGSASSGAAPATLPRRLHRVVLRLLRPTEAAVRRLIVIVASQRPDAPSPEAPGPRVPSPEPVRPARAQAAAIIRRKHKVLPAIPGRRGIIRPRPPAQPRPGSAPPSPRALPLFDRPQRLVLGPVRRLPGVPRISLPGLSPPVRRRGAPPTPDDPIAAAALVARLRAVQAALADLDGQAARLAGWRARWRSQITIPAPADARRSDARPGYAHPRDSPRFIRRHPLRVGRPPGFRRRGRHPVHGLLRECHLLALEAWDDWALRETAASAAGEQPERPPP